MSPVDPTTYIAKLKEVLPAGVVLDELSFKNAPSKIRLIDSRYMDRDKRVSNKRAQDKVGAVPKVGAKSRVMGRCNP